MVYLSEVVFSRHSNPKPIPSPHLCLLPTLGPVSGGGHTRLRIDGVGPAILELPGSSGKSGSAMDQSTQSTCTPSLPGCLGSAARGLPCYWVGVRHPQFSPSLPACIHPSPHPASPHPPVLAIPLTKATIDTEVPLWGSMKPALCHSAHYFLLSLAYQVYQETKHTCLLDLNASRLSGSEPQCTGRSTNRALSLW